MSELFSSHPRRRFVGRAAAALAALTGFSTIASADTVTSSLDESEHDAWMKALKGKHRQLFHTTSAQDSAMLMASNYLDTYVEAFKAKPTDVNAVIGVHGAALVIGFNDAAWAKYGMGKAANIMDPATKEPATKNTFNLGGALGVETLQKRGAVFLMCNNALRLRSRMLAGERNEPFDQVYADLAASRLPGVILVPAMVVAINRAQEAGFTYVRA